MRYVLLFFVFSMLSFNFEETKVFFWEIHTTHAQVTGVKDILRDPAVSTRCKSLIKERNNKITIKQKLLSLIKRNQRLLKIAPENKKSTIMKLEVNSRQLQNQLRLTNFKIQSMEENIVRQGCPGMVL